jgi:iron(III) transport system substrate-binding protein
MAGRSLDPIREAMILPEVLDESKWWEGKHRYGDPQGKYIFAYIGHPEAGGVFYNARVLNPTELQSFWDFLNPKWKGRIEARDIRAGSGPGTGFMRFYYYNPLIGSRFIWRLFSEMDITLFRDRRQSVDWLAAGKFAICFFCARSDIGTAQSQGLPVGIFGLMKEGAGLTTSSGTLGLVNKAPHPNAAKVFINWLLSREGQITMQIEYSKARVGVSNSLRMDIPKDMVPPDQRLMPGVNYVEVDTPERISMEPVLKVLNEALAVSRK